MQAAKIKIWQNRLSGATDMRYDHLASWEVYCCAKEEGLDLGRSISKNIVLGFWRVNGYVNLIHKLIWLFPLIFRVFFRRI